MIKLVNRLRKASFETSTILLEQINQTIENDKSIIEFSTEGRSLLAIALDCIQPNDAQNAAILSIIAHFPHQVILCDTFGGWKPIHRAIKHKFNAQVIAELLKHSPHKFMLQTDADGIHPLHRAIKSLSEESEDCVLEILKYISCHCPHAASDVDNPGTQRVALHFAARYGTPEVILRTVVLQPEQVESIEIHTGSTPLHLYLQRFLRMNNNHFHHMQLQLHATVVKVLATPKVMSSLDSRGRTPSDICVSAEIPTHFLKELLMRDPVKSEKTQRIDMHSMHSTTCSRQTEGQEKNRQGKRSAAANATVELESRFYSPIRNPSFVRKHSAKGPVLLH
jgi:hypothetical protein